MIAARTDLAATDPRFGADPGGAAADHDRSRGIGQLPRVDSPASALDVGEAVDRPAGASAGRPAIAVLMTAYNADATIKEAVASILNGTEPCDLYVVDDCSRNPVSTLLDPGDPRVHIIRLETNVGPARGRNKGLERILAEGYPYVAIMDADDIAYPARLERQRAFLDGHPSVGAVGTWSRFVDEKTKEPVFMFRSPISPVEARHAMFYNSPVMHPSSLIRTSALRAVGCYDGRFRTAEDYELFQRIGRRYDLANLPECLLDYRMSPGGQSLGNRHRQLADRLSIQWLYFDPSQWRAWAGIGWTLALFLLPNSWLIRLKVALKR